MQTQDNTQLMWTEMHEAITAGQEEVALSLIRGARGDRAVSADPGGHHAANAGFRGGDAARDAGAHCGWSQCGCDKRCLGQHL